jgi:hypothetical protein
VEKQQGMSLSNERFGDQRGAEVLLVLTMRGTLSKGLFKLVDANNSSSIVQTLIFICHVIGSCTCTSTEVCTSTYQYR